MISVAAARAIAHGHPWLWRDAVIRGGERLAAGVEVRLLDPAGSFAGSGLWDPGSPIVARVFSRRPGAAIDLALVIARVQRALLLRDRWFADRATTAYRLCHGEGDRVPGLVLDRYDEVVVARADGGAMDAWLGPIAEGIQPLLRDRGVRTIARRRPRPAAGAAHQVGASPDEDESGRLELMLGPPPPAMVMVRENGIAMAVDLLHGQKTGAFLDQRDNRERVRGMANGRRVLNLFSYAGGFSTAAALGGATRVTSVDLARGAHAAAQQSMRANALDPGAHTFVTADVFSFLEGARKRGDRWDLVISDPPSFAPSEKARPRALGSYRRLHAAAAAVLAPGGILCAASCSSHVSSTDFLATLDDASLAREDLSVVGQFGPPCDHPIVAGWPEGQYLKFAVLC